MYRPTCFIIMPFGKKKYFSKNSNDTINIDYDEVYTKIIKPAVEAADMQPIRADQETTRGIIHKPMFERIILSDYVVADVTGANANVFYELGIRHAVKPYTTITIFAGDSDLPFDLGPVRSAPYQYDPAKGVLDTDRIRQYVTEQLTEATQTKTTDSPVYQLVEGIQFQNSVAHEKTDIFRDLVVYNETQKKALSSIRRQSKEQQLKALTTFVSNLKLANEETGVLIDVMLTYRAIGAYEEMIDFIRRMPLHVQQTVMVQEQLGFALNREGKREEARDVLLQVIDRNGPSSETYGLLGRVYKDEWEAARTNNNTMLAEGKLDQAIEAYTNGFEADWRDAYPGINMLTLLEVKGESDKIKQLAPVVEYAVLRKMATKKPDYWDYATLLELAVIANDHAKAVAYLKKAISTEIEGSWMIKTTLKNLKMIDARRAERGQNQKVSADLIAVLEEQLKTF